MHAIESPCEKGLRGQDVNMAIGKTQAKNIVSIVLSLEYGCGEPELLRFSSSYPTALQPFLRQAI